MTLKTVSILGCGWYGLALAKSLIDDGLRVQGSTTSKEKISHLATCGISPFLVCFEHDMEEYEPQFFECDVLVISIPPKRRSGEASLYIAKIERIKNAAILYGVEKVIFISSTSVYGDCNCELDEDTIPVPETESGKAIMKAEEVLKMSGSMELAIIRFGGLFGPGRDPARFFAGKKEIPNGKSPVNLIHLDDCIGITKAVLEKQAFGYTFNACSSDHPEKMDFYTKAALKSNLEKPAFISELLSWKIIKSKNLTQVLNYIPRPL